MRRLVTITSFTVDKNVRRTDSDNLTDWILSFQVRV